MPMAPVCRCRLRGAAAVLKKPDKEDPKKQIDKKKSGGLFTIDDMGSKEYSKLISFLQSRGFLQWQIDIAIRENVH